MSNSVRCPACGTENSQSARFCSGCGARVEDNHSPYQTPASSTGRPVIAGSAMVSEYIYAGFWKRLLARIIDSIIYAFGFWVFAILFSLKLSVSHDGELSPQELINAVGLFYLVLYGGWWLYNALMESSSMQATLGKKALGIKVTDELGYPISFWRATGRHMAALISGLTFLVGYLLAAFTSKKQTLHDMIAGCLVINNNFDSVQVQTAALSPRQRMSAGAIAGIIFAVLFIPIVGILAAIGLPAYQDYSVRAAISSAINDTQFIQQNIVDYAETNGIWPDNLTKAGVKNSRIQSDKYRINLGKEGRYQILFQQPELIANKGVIFTPHLIKGGRYQWQCSSQSIDVKYLPTICREQ